MHVEKMKVMAGSVRKLLRRRAFGHVVNLLAKLHPGDISNVLQELNDRDQQAVFSVLIEREKRLAALALTDLGIDRSIHLLTAMPPVETARVLQELETDDRAMFVSSLPEDVAEQVLEQMRLEESLQVQGLLQYEEETAGRIMTPHVFALREDLSVSEAIHTIQTTQDLEMVFYLYVVDERNHLVGVASLRQLLMVPPSTSLKKVMTTNVISVHTDTDQEEVAQLVALYDLLAIPVVDHENKLLGVITVDDVIDVIKDEATEDILHLAGVEADDHVQSNALTSVRKRLPWLGANLGTALGAATVVALYEPTIAALPQLAVFLPVVAGLGGSSGTQTLTVMVRSMALGEISWKNTRHALFKEIKVGLFNGLVLGFLAGLIAYFWKGSYLLGAVLSAGMLCTMLVAGLTGTLVPLLLKRLNIDPAIASGIFLTTFCDVVGFFSFLGLAAYLLR